MKQINKEILIGDLIKKHPESVEVLLDHGMHCVGCHVATWETLEQAAASHGIDSAELVKNLNKQLKLVG